MTADARRAILVLGGSEPSPELLLEAGRYAEVFVLARAVPDDDSRYLVDLDRAEASARQRLHRVTKELRARGSATTGLIGDADARAARRDALALFPQPSTLLEAA